MPFRWTDEYERILRAGHARGQSARSIAVDIGNGCTQHAVEWKTTKLGLPKKPRKGSSAHGGHKTAAHVLASAQARSLPPKAARQPDPAFADRPGSIGLMALRHTTCRWPFDAPSGVRYCGCRVVSGRPYCPDHEAMSQPKTRDIVAEEAA